MILPMMLWKSDEKEEGSARQSKKKEIFSTNRAKIFPFSKKGISFYGNLRDFENRFFDSQGRRTSLLPEKWQTFFFPFLFFSMVVLSFCTASRFDERLSQLSFFSSFVSFVNNGPLNNCHCNRSWDEAEDSSQGFRSRKLTLCFLIFFLSFILSLQRTMKVKQSSLFYHFWRPSAVFSPKNLPGIVSLIEKIKFLSSGLVPVPSAGHLDVHVLALVLSAVHQVGDVVRSSAPVGIHTRALVSLHSHVLLLRAPRTATAGREPVSSWVVLNRDGVRSWSQGNRCYGSSLWEETKDRRIEGFEGKRVDKRKLLRRKRKGFYGFCLLASVLCLGSR